MRILQRAALLALGMLSAAPTVVNAGDCPANCHKGAYAAMSVGAASQGSRTNVQTSEFEAISGMADNQLGVFDPYRNTSRSDRPAGKYETSHLVPEAENMIYGDALRFNADLRLGYTMAAGKRFLLGTEAVVLYSSGNGAASDVALQVNPEAIFDNGPLENGNKCAQFKSEISDGLAADTFYNHNRLNKQHTFSKISNAFDMGLDLKNNWQVHLLANVGYAIDEKCAVGLKAGVSLSQWQVETTITGEYGSAGVFLSRFRDSLGADAQVEWKHGDETAAHNIVSAEPLEASGSGDAFFLGLVFAPHVQMAISKNLSIFLEGKAVLHFEKDIDYTVTMPEGFATEAVDVTATVESNHMLMASVGLLWKFGQQK